VLWHAGGCSDVLVIIMYCSGLLDLCIYRAMATCQPPNAHGKKEYELVGLHNLPIVETPWSWVSDHWWTFQKGACADDEYYFMKCVGHVGVARAPTECKQLHDDFIECVFQYKTVCLYFGILFIISVSNAR